MSRPRILVPVPTSFDAEYNSKCWPEFAQAIADAGGEAVALPLTHTAQELEMLVKESAGILLPGSGADVSPEQYGHERAAACADPDPLREQTDRALFEAALQTRKPLLGVCFGTQSMNVFFGGTLHQDCDPLPLNHRAGRAVAAAHAVLIAPDSRLGRILVGAEDSVDAAGVLRLLVNSSHHQAIDLPGDELRIVARSPDDGVIEAVEGGDPEHWFIGVQWHPERTIGSSAASRALFEDFVRASGGQ